MNEVWDTSPEICSVIAYFLETSCLLLAFLTEAFLICFLIGAGDLLHFVLAGAAIAAAPLKTTRANIAGIILFMVNTPCTYCCEIVFRCQKLTHAVSHGVVHTIMMMVVMVFLYATRLISIRRTNSGTWSCKRGRCRSEENAYAESNSHQVFHRDTSIAESHY